MRRNKKERKKIKAIRLRNKKLLKKYPWLAPIDLWARRINTYDFTLLDQMEDGWRKAFGILMIKDIDKALNGHMLHTNQIKEKYGRLTWYFSTDKEVYDAVDNVIDAYSYISEHVCIHCGQPDVGYTSGYIIPICKKCFCHDDYYTKKDYYDQTSQWTRMPLEYSYSRHEPGTEGWTKYTVDISEYTNKVRINWYKRNKLKEN